MTKICDHTSVGVIIREIDGRILAIKRRNYLQAVALPAGHLDGDSFEAGLLREVEEEVGISVDKHNLVFEGWLDNPCKRTDGTHHQWKVYGATRWHGQMRAGSDAKEAFWISKPELQEYASRTEYFMKKYGIGFGEVARLTCAIFGNPADPQVDPEWAASPGLEPVWYVILNTLGIIQVQGKTP